MRTTETRHSTVQVSGARLAVDETGHGPVVIQAHGLGSNRGQDRETGFDFSGLESTHRLVRYDARAHGDSGGEPEPTHYTWAHLALDLLSVRSQVSPQAPVDAIGASMGAATILHAALAVPEAFRRLVLLIPPTAWDTRAAQAAAYADAATLVEKHGLRALLAAQAAQPQPPAARQGRTEPQGSADLFPSVVRGAALSDLPPADDLKVLDRPTLILPWAGDAGHPVSTAERLAEVLPNATLHEPARTPEEVSAWAPLVGEFLR
ncbi:alpha/beta hydrolase [Kineosporia sp. J2-2]|uniref:Alpha/beta hydrolase n=1 Tax=Kineosporia corallincola TaxID=2835133 RepID=A0ABS5TDF9_9ACTN|nr:alpha/beta hydrolase [Kineosporia corallincola]MBT0769125.1 alpha/beta hydrolase [Kineosporia corallincola]